MTKIKICGLFRKEDVAAVNAAKPDYAGFIVDFPISHRSVSLEAAKNLAANVDKSISSVGVFVDAPMDVVIEAAKGGIFDMIQLHGGEDEAYIRRVRRKGGKPVIKAFIVKDAEDIKRAAKSPADYVLLDKGRGEGVPFDWRLLSGLKMPYFLAGGIDAANVRMALTMGAPYAVDVSSGVETEKKKDPKKIEEIIRIIRDIPERGN